MSKVVLTQRAESGYDDVPGELYHFPKQYLRAAEEAVGDGCLFYEPRRNNGRLVYWASGRISSVYPDPTKPDHFYARIDQFLPFPEPVFFERADGGYWESKLDRGDGQPSRGAMGWSIRRIPEQEFDLILKAGYAPALGLANDAAADQSAWGVQEGQLDFERPIFEQISQRPFRDRVFATQVRSAYDSRCAVTGLKIINGGGRAEMEAAHIKPVAEKGPDSVRNGVALSRTVHWMFDRGLLSIDDDFRLLTAKPLLPEGVERLFDPSGYVHVPEAARDQPSRAFLRWHRENCFKG
ncbi:MAG: HNH endonuclease [Oceanicaulis sp.]